MKTSLVISFMSCLLLGICWATSGLPEGLLPEGYQKDDMPLNKKGPLEVNVSAIILGVRNFDPDSLEVTAVLHLKQHWLDSRLQASNITITNGQNAVWTPDVHFPTAIRTYFYTGPFDQVHIGINGSVIHTQKVEVRVPCKTELRWFPYDTPKCNITLEPSVYRKEQVNLTWGGPVTMSEEINSAASLDLELMSGNGTQDTTDSTKSRLVITLKFSRSYGHYGLTVFLPVAMFTLLVYFAFLLDAEEPIARILLITMMLVTLVNVSHSAREKIANTSSCTGYDIWTGGCSVFMVIALIESVLVKKFGASSEGDKTGVLQGIFQKIAKWGDRVMIIAYPITFVIFVVIYCGVYLS